MLCRRYGSLQLSGNIFSAQFILLLSCTPAFEAWEDKQTLSTHKFPVKARPDISHALQCSMGAEEMYPRGISLSLKSC